MYIKYGDLYFSINYHTVTFNELKNYTQNNPAIMIKVALWNIVMP